jgi:hypothetical protein
MVHKHDPDEKFIYVSATIVETSVADPDPGLGAF